MNALTLPLSRQYAAESALPSKPVHLSVVSREHAFVGAVNAGIALADRKFKAATAQPNNLRGLAIVSVLVHLFVVWSVTHKGEADVAPIIPEMVVEIYHPQQQQVQAVTPEPPKLQTPRIIPTPEDVIIPKQAPVVQTPVPAPTAPATPNTIAEPVETITEPSANAAYLRNPAPVYPEMAERMRWEGVVTLKVHVLANGHPDAIEIQRSSGRSVLDQAAVKTVKNWMFVAAKRGQTPVDGWVAVPIEFKLGR